MTTKIIRSIAIDFICLAAVWSVAILWNIFGVPYERGFFCDDTSIRYPYKDSTVTDTMLYSYGLCLPIGFMLIVEMFRWRNKTHSGRMNRQNSTSAIYLSSLRIPDVIVDLVHVIGVFLFGAACNTIVTDMGKFTIGRLRPHFIAVCQPENMAELCPVEGPPIYVTDFNCTATNLRRLQDSRLSFPSGHASVSAYTMLFLAFYLQSRMTWSGSKLLRHTIQIGALLMAWFTGLSRISDYKHHWSDVLTGYLIGAISASLTALYVSALFKKRPTLNMEVIPRKRNDTELVYQIHANN